MSRQLLALYTQDLGHPGINDGILLGFLIAAKIVDYIVKYIVRKATDKTKTKIDDLIFERTKKPIFYFILVYGLSLAMSNLGRS